ncbi:MAG: response regulator [Dehalococcoidia bacterium]
MKTILVADDEEAVRALVTFTLGSNRRYRLLLAGDGEEAIQLVKKNNPDLLLLDIMMPKKDGFDVCREIKTAGAFNSNMKVVMLTALAQEADREKAMEAGADGYFTKPFSPTALLQKVEEFLG